MHQVILIGSTLLASWLGLQAVHELGHMLGAWATGAEVTRVVLTPTTISRTDVAQNSRPLLVAWAGPVIGAVLPLLLWCCARFGKAPAAYVPRFFAGTCLLANGLYMGLGSFGRVGDCGDLLRHGAKLWQLWLFGAVAVPAGLLLWHGLGPSFGLGAARGRVSHRVAYVMVVVSLALLLLGFAVGER